MVPGQSRQLVILSVSFAALVAFFWYRRRKSSSHSDPGGTLALKIQVDKPARNELTDAVSEITDQLRESVSQEICSVEKTKDSSSLPLNIEEIAIKNIEIVPNADEEVIESQFTRDLETNIFHSTPIDKNKAELVQSFVKELIEKVPEEEIIPLDEQSTLENIALQKKTIGKEPETTLTLDQSICTSTDCSNLSSTTDPIENISTDTGVGSLVIEDLSTEMAQGQKTEQKTENNAAGLEKKLASLALNTQQPAQRSERDSANHSPAEVMLSSPAITNFSDAHSEVVKWLDRCEPVKPQQVDMFDTVHIYVPLPYLTPILWCSWGAQCATVVSSIIGSSDSGKGCSDVVTPPSCTPVGGSSVAGDQLPSIYEFVLPQVVVGRLIGRHGSFLHDIRAKTHTNTFIKRHPKTNDLKICAIEGSQQDIDAALKMIRQKFPLRRFPDLTLDRVSFVKNSCLPINPENLQLQLVEGVNNDVLLSSLITAGHFFLQLPTHISYQSLYRLACIMNSVYNTQESPPLPDPKPDVVCVAPAHGGWYRAQILSVDEEAHTSDIRFMDYGGYLTVTNASLRQIRGDFLLLPFQAVECVLANIIPAGGEEEWSQEAKQFVQLMTTQQTLQAQVYSYTETGLPLVYLYCTQFYQSLTDPSGYETKVVLLNQELVSRGYADLVSWEDDEETSPTEPT